MGHRESGQWVTTDKSSSQSPTLDRLHQHQRDQRLITREVSDNNNNNLQLQGKNRPLVVVVGYSPELQYQSRPSSAQTGQRRIAPIQLKTNIIHHQNTSVMAAIATTNTGDVGDGGGGGRAQGRSVSASTVTRKIPGTSTPRAIGSGTAASRKKVFGHPL